MLQAARVFFQVTEPLLFVVESRFSLLAQLLQFLLILVHFLQLARQFGCCGKF